MLIETHQDRQECKTSKKVKSKITLSKMKKEGPERSRWCTERQASRHSEAIQAAQKWKWYFNTRGKEVNHCINSVSVLYTGGFGLILNFKFDIFRKLFKIAKVRVGMKLLKS